MISVVVSELRKYTIVFVAVGLASVVFLSLQFVPLAAFTRHVDAPCSRTEAWRGLLQRESLKATVQEIKANSSRIDSDPSGFENWRTPHGEYWIPALTRSALPSLVYQQKVGIYTAGPTPVRRGDVVLDGGAHVGLFTRVALNAGAKLVIAIEPAPENIECLRRNFRREIAEGRVVIYPKGIWDKVDVLPMFLNRNSAGDSFIQDRDPKAGTIDLPLTTVDLLVSELHLPRVDYIKLDIKGAEVRALHGAHRTLASFRPRLAIASDHQENDTTEIPRAVAAANSNYRLQCGACYAVELHVHPEVLHFF
jgi:FkbM family methyltransferase